MALLLETNGNSRGMIPTDATVSLELFFYGYNTVRNGYTAYWSRVMRSPNTDEFNLYVNGERLLETFATTPTIFIFAVVHGPCKWNLLGVVRREQPDLLDHTCEGSSSVCTSNYKFR